MEIKLNTQISTRDGTLTKDAKRVNMMGFEKRPGLQASLAAAPSVAQGLFTYNGAVFSITADTLVAGPGSTLNADGTQWADQGAPTNPWMSSAAHSSPLVVNGTAYILTQELISGTYYYYRYTTTDGVTYTKTSLSMPLNVSPLQAGFVFLGGYFYLYTTNGTWRSTNAVTWANIAGIQPWSTYNGLGRFGAIVFNNKMWVLGGYDGATTWARVWSSPDGVNWTLVTSAPGWAARVNARPVVLGISMYIFAGNAGGNNLQDVWSTLDGATWTQQTAAAGFQNYWYGQTVYNGKIWVVVDNGASGGQVMSSPGGSVWTVVRNTVPWNTGGAEGDFLDVLENTLSFFDPNTHAWFSQQGTPTGPSYPLAPTVLNQPFDFVLSQAAVGALGFMFKSATDAYYFNSSTLTKITNANYPANTVPGIVYLDGSYYVGTADSKIWGSAIEDPTTWSALNFVSANTDSDSLVAIAKSLNYLVAFGQLSTEFFYDAALAAPASPLAPLLNAFNTIGCASAGSIVSTENLVIFMSRTKETGRSISVLTGLQIVQISTPFIDKILNLDSLATVYAWSGKFGGHKLYVLTLKSLNLTLVYDFALKEWTTWSSSVAKSALSVSSLTQVNGIATATITGHSFSDGDPVDIAGATPTGYNGRQNVTFVDANTVTFPVSSSLTSPATGVITATGYSTGYFTCVNYTAASGYDWILHETNGKIYKVLTTVYQDDGAPIDMQVVIDNVRSEGTSDFKRIGAAELIADKVASNIYIRYTDDDYSTWTKYRSMLMSAKRCRALRMGNTRRRAFQLRHTDNVPVRVDSLMLTVA